MNRLTMILLMMSFASCRSFERQLICNKIDEYKISVSESCVFSPKHNTCYCSEFDFDTWRVKGELRREPLDYCEGFQGFRTKEGLSNIQPNMTALKRLKEDSCNVKQ